MNLIAAVDKNWAIGKNNELLVSIPNDMKMFRQMTTLGILKNHSIPICTFLFLV